MFQTAIRDVFYFTLRWRNYKSNFGLTPPIGTRYIFSYHARSPKVSIKLCICYENIRANRKSAVSPWQRVIGPGWSDGNANLRGVNLQNTVHTWRFSLRFCWKTTISIRSYNNITFLFSSLFTILQGCLLRDFFNFILSTCNYLKSIFWCLQG